jgi:hypothetical protein
MNDDSDTPIMYDHCMTVYKRMAGEAVIKEVEGTRMAVWEGFLTGLIQNDLGLAVPYYSAIRAHLVRMGCMKQLRRGGGTSPSQWQVIKPPSKEQFATAEASGTALQRRKETHAQQINDLTTRIATLEANERTLAAVVMNMQKTLDKHIGQSDVHSEVA